MSGKDDTPQVIRWRKHKVYRCRMCAFDSLDKKQFEDHIVRAHSPLRVIEGGKSQKPVAPVESKETNDGHTSS